MRAALLAGLAAGLAAVAGPAAARMSPGRVMSLDSCADQYVLALAARETIVGVSPRADAPDSFLRARAAGLAKRRTTLEAVLGARPDVVVRQWGGDARLTTALDRRGVRTISLGDATDFDGVRANVRQVAQALDRGREGETLLARMDAELKRAAGAGRKRAAFYLTPGGYTAGPNTMIDAMLRAAGFTNASTQPYFSPAPLERLVLTPPRAVVLGFFDLTRAGADRWGPGRHAALRQATRGRVVASLPGAMLGCSAWFAADGARVLAEAAR
ncbi:ABC transporter substrate-binding protein [Caulobacter sp. UNC279MFTsu5.1]|uniref:ABC transporter substrate-binding protein n=1 Tax=Caulobacter sp. UNC279MFTsu5.1 TaxID=1502775 RepID=UPI0008E0F466|nr:ABC transporter substrate-binding protein [Caulobacter sp. UNC279MFTsu5.1]SFJ79383.1 iron complex transport system substrate-binding protein [Caulobacter sp. UNC279MFTsu5.1]